MLYTEAQGTSAGQDNQHPFASSQRQEADSEGHLTQLPRQPPVSPSEAVHLLVKYHQAIELIKKHKQQQQQATQALLAVL